MASQTFFVLFLLSSIYFAKQQPLLLSVKVTKRFRYDM